MLERQRQREATRARLLSAGLRVVARKGFASATTAAIASATGRAHGTVFVHFPTRDALVAELVREVGRVMSARLAELSGDQPALAHTLDAHLQALGEREALCSRVLAEAATLPAAARAHLFAMQSGVAHRIRLAWQRALEAGEVRALDPATPAMVWISLTNHHLIHRDLFAPGDSVIKRHGARIKREFMALIAADPASPPRRNHD